MKKRVLPFVLALCLLFALSACNGGSGAGNKSGDEASSRKADSKETESGAESRALKAPDHVQAAIDAAGHLTTGEYFLAQDGTVLTLQEPDRGGVSEFCTAYAALSQVKKLVIPCSQTEVFALTESGELYYKDTKILDGVLDMVYKTNNVNQEAYAVTEDNLYSIIVRDTADVISTLREKNPDNYIDVNGKTVSCIGSIFVERFRNQGKPARGRFTSISASRSDFSVVSADGKVYRNMDNPEDYESTPSIFDWENVVLFDARKDMLSSAGDSERKVDVTAAAILADGSVVAEGTYAEDILSWGELSYLSLADPVIVGLTPEGTLKVAGGAVENVAQELAGWTDIVAVKASSDSSGSGIINAMDKEGTWYYLRSDSSGEIYKNIRLSVTDGASPESGSAYKFTPDGSIYRTTWDNTSWIPYEADD